MRKSHQIYKKTVLKLRESCAIIYLFLFFSVFFSFKENSEDEKVEWLKQNAQNINTIDFDTEDFSDLEYLKTVIGKSSIVMLGEARHGDSITSEAKMRVINYLNTKLGFNILLEERGMYNTESVVKNLNEKQSVLQALKKGNYQFLYETDIRFWNFIKSKMRSDTTFHVAGIDFFHDSTYIEDLKQLVSKVDPKVVDGHQWKSFESYYSTFNTSDLKTKKLKFTDFLTDANYVIEALKSRLSDSSYNNKKITWWIKSIENVEQGFGWVINRPKPNGEKISEYNALRDKALAEMIEWYIDYYKDNKVIVSTSTYHISRNLNFVRTSEKDIVKAKPMGDYLWEKYPDKIYSIAFISYSGTTTKGNGKDVPVSTKTDNSIEALIHKAGFSYALLDLRHVYKSKNGEWLKDFFIMEPTFNQSYNV
jgi:erythromycin esterase